MHFRERLSVPLAYWVILGLFTLSMMAAFFFYLGPGWAIGVGALTLLAIGAVFWAASTVIEVGDGAVRVGRAMIEFGYLKNASSLTEAEMRLRRGPGADARAFLVLRPYVGTGVELTLDDPDDPVPYWLVASRRPVELAAAVQSHLAERPTR
ncbi:DUF3093 domain-containing protein [Microlunatus panaciterrae]|uniref:DUF3093 domain-containing protein n=1 Tax=Microlunatus panaciterrae TaxID=400768 RepID=A0ABS2RRV7_9ACTN|nr:DUF3093 domain-containing protein [Microlunatus panaciterrae]MBM7800674.1 hypothetical protein [Microlunatus panaciterrae]